ncbi:alpha-lactalbumin [Psammomys obesus]|uniref:alpha-lactalbumin n=1 Tax=Psammomys obesus TaxID=48139 RepID=UPI002452A206|nr:alpha-lactalbumin [Psammomys obesus]
MCLAPFFLVCLLFPAIQATQLTKCEVAQAIKDIDGHQGVSLLEWICILFHTSGYDTKAVVKNEDATEYGLFQISNKFWCKSSEIPESQNICGISCDKFLNDDLTDDIECVKKILAFKGIDNWPAHKPMCSQELEQWRCRKV